MSQYDENIIYQNEKIDIQFEYLYDYNKEYFTFMLSIRTEMFVGKQEFYINIDYVNKLIIQIKDMYELNNGKVLLSDSNSESYIVLLMNGYNDVRLQGKIGNVFDLIHMDFDIKVDQTTISLIQSKLKDVYA